MVRKPTTPPLSSLSQTDLKIEYRMVGAEKNISVITLNGHISPAGATALQDVLKRLDEKGSSLFLIDFRSVTKICSAGIALLVAFRTKKSIEAPLKHPQITEPFVLIGLSNEIQTVLKELGILELFPIFPDQTAAFDTLGLKE